MKLTRVANGGSDSVTALEKKFDDPRSDETGNLTFIFMFRNYLFNAYKFYFTLVKLLTSFAVKKLKEKTLLNLKFISVFLYYDPRTKIVISKIVISDHDFGLKVFVHQFSKWKKKLHKFSAFAAKPIILYF